MRLAWVNYSLSAHGVGAWTSKKPFEHNIHNTHPRILENPLSPFHSAFLGFCYTAFEASRPFSICFFAFYFLEAL